MSKKDKPLTDAPFSCNVDVLVDGWPTEIKVLDHGGSAKCLARVIVRAANQVSRACEFRRGC